MPNPFSILIIASRLPRPVGKGDSMTVYHLVKYLASRGHQVHLVSFDGVDPFQSAPRAEVLEELRSWCATVELVPFNHQLSRLRALRGLFSSEPLQVWYFRYLAMQEAVEQVIVQHRPEVLYAHNFRTAQYLRARTEAPTISGLMLSYALNYKRMSEHLTTFYKRWLYAFEYKRLKHYERDILKNFGRVLLISEKDKQAIVSETPAPNVFFNPHGLDVAYYGKDLGLTKTQRSIIMTGDFGYPPNWEAGLFFYHEVFPRVRKAVPDAQLWFVGREPVRAIEDLGKDPSVTVTGWVDDLRIYLQQAEVAVVPVRIAAGMQNKIIVSMAAGVPVVATHAANEGIRAIAGKEILLGDTPEELADAVIRLLTDDNQRNQLARQAQEYVQKYWTWEYHFSKFEEMVQQLIAEGPDGEVEQYIFRSEHHACS